LKGILHHQREATTLPKGDAGTSSPRRK
jgi:hypothetical protein